MHSERTPPRQHDATHDDAQRFERRQVQQNLDRRRERAAAFEDQFGPETVRATIDDLREAGLVQLQPAAERYRHQPTGTLFASAEALVLFHEGWRAGQEGDGQ